MEEVVDRLLGMIMMNNRLAKDTSEGLTVGVTPDHGVGVGEKHHLRFIGIFPGTGKMERFVRPVHVIFSSPEVVVAADRETTVLYVVDMREKLSLGCRMTAEFFKPEELAVTKIPTRIGSNLLGAQGSIGH